MTVFHIEIQDELVPLLEKAAEVYGITVERFLAVIIETALYSGVVMTEKELSQRLSEPRRQEVLSRIERGFKRSTIQNDKEEA